MKKKRVYSGLREVSITPSVNTKDEGQRGGEKFGEGSKSPLTLTKRFVEVEFLEDLVQVTTYLHFFNSHQKTLQGELAFPLEENVTISGYGLDISGSIVDAVPVPKKKAQIVFDEVVRNQEGSVAVAEQSEGNVFNLMIYPLEPQKMRIVKLVYFSSFEKVDNVGSVWIPFNVTDSLKEFEFGCSEEVSFEIQVEKDEKRVVHEKKAKLSLDDIRKVGKKVEGVLIKLGMSTSTKNVMYVEKHPSKGVHFFGFEIENPKQKVEKTAPLKKVKIYYDCSFSRVLNKSNIEREKHIISSFVKKFSANEAFSCEIIPFSDKTHAGNTLKSTDDVEDFWKTLVFDGGSSFPTLEKGELSLSLIFTDGFFNFTNEPLTMEKIKFSHPCHVVSSSVQNNFNLLRYICRSSGGVFFGRSVSATDVVDKIWKNRERKTLLKCDFNKKEIEEVYFKSSETSTRVYGVAISDKAKLTLDFGDEKIEKILQLSGGGEHRVVVTKSLTGKMFGQQKIAHLSVFPEDNKDEIESIGRDFGIVTPNTSLIVLEKLSQYVKYKIVPPFSLKKMRKEYNNSILKEEESENERIKEKIESISGNWNTRMEWYKKKFPYRDVVLEEIDKFIGICEIVEKFKYKSVEVNELKEKSATFKKTLSLCKGLIGEKKRRQANKDLNEIKPLVNELSTRYDSLKKKVEEETKKIKDEIKQLDDYVQTCGSFRIVSKKNSKEISEIQNFLKVEYVDKKLFQDVGGMLKEMEIEKARQFFAKTKSEFDEKFTSKKKRFEELVQQEGTIKKKSDELDQFQSDLTSRMQESTTEEKKSEHDSLKKEASSLMTFLRALNGKLLESGYEAVSKQFDDISKQVATLNQKMRELYFLTIEEEEGESDGSEDESDVKRKLFYRRKGMKQGRKGKCCCSKKSVCRCCCSSERSAAPMSQCLLLGKADKDVREDDSEEGSEASIKVKAWTPNSKYIVELKKHSKNQDKYKEYLKQRKNFENSPSFFLDVGDYFLSLKENQLGVRILSNILELGLDDVQLLRIVGYRLEQAKELVQSKNMFMKVRKLADHEPQSYRDLALVFEQLGEYDKALEGLWNVVVGKWDGRFREIEQTALVELNHVLWKFPKEERKNRLSKLKQFDKNFVLHMPMDMRVVMGWDTDMTDIDLHVHDPCGEHCYYSSKTTSTRGIYTHDFTKGYGPEEFLIRVAPPGKYDIKAKYYASHKQSLTGATTILLKFYTNYMRETEKSDSVTIRLDTNKDMIDCCEIEFF